VSGEGVATPFSRVRPLRQPRGPAAQLQGANAAAPTALGLEAAV